jgi:hypothetical protein
MVNIPQHNVGQLGMCIGQKPLKGQIWKVDRKPNSASFVFGVMEVNFEVSKYNKSLNKVRTVRI